MFACTGRVESATEESNTIPFFATSAEICSADKGNVLDFSYEEVGHHIGYKKQRSQTSCPWGLIPGLTCLVSPTLSVLRVAISCRSMSWVNRGDSPVS